jgi:endonuclease YncB( thermonuclease family)
MSSHERLRPRRGWILGAAALGLALFVAQWGEAARSIGGTVQRVVDGDTVVVRTSRTNLRCRLVGVDAPEVSHRTRQGEMTPGQPYGPEAKRALEQMALHRPVTAEVHGRDRYRRSLCVLFVGGRNLNLEMVRLGFAWAEPERWSDAPPALLRELQVTEQEAWRAARGLWADPNPEPPWAFRRRMRSAGR